MSRRGENIFKRKDGRWEGRYKNGCKDNGKTKYSSVYAHTYSECSTKLYAAKNKQISGNIPITVGQLFEHWLESRKNTVKQSTYMHYKTLYDNHIRLRFENIKAEAVSAFMINRYVSDLFENGGVDENGLSANTVQSVMIILKSLFAYGEKIYNLPNPTKLISLPKVETDEPETFTRTEIEKIRLNGLYGDISELGILLCLYTGMRIGEICALKWVDIDLQSQLISVNKTLQRIKNPHEDKPKTIVIIDKPKSSKSVRKIPVPTFMLIRLAELKKNNAPESYFLTCSMKYTEPRAFQNHYKNFLESLDISYRNFHVLRHTFATECIGCGIDVKTVSELLGHSSVKITLERYVHPSMDNKRRQLEKLYAL